MSRIFISYKRVDKEKVFKIKDQIESALGEKCWIDLDGIESDAQFASVIINAIDEAEVFLFMFSAAHAKIEDYENDWTIRELNYAKEEKKTIYFINIDKTRLTKWFKFMFPQKQQIDATSEDALGKMYDDLKVKLFPEKVAERKRTQKDAENGTKRKNIVDKSLKESKETDNSKATKRFQPSETAKAIVSLYAQKNPRKNSTKLSLNTIGEWFFSSDLRTWVFLIVFNLICIVLIGWFVYNEYLSNH